MVWLYDGWGGSFILRRRGDTFDAVYRWNGKSKRRTFVLFAVSGFSVNMRCWRDTLHNSVDFAE